jgi:hypothetical protein
MIMACPVCESDNITYKKNRWKKRALFKSSTGICFECKHEWQRLDGAYKLTAAEDAARKKDHYT